MVGGSPRLARLTSGTAIETFGARQTNRAPRESGTLFKKLRKYQPGTVNAANHQSQGRDAMSDLCQRGGRMAGRTGLVVSDVRDSAGSQDPAGISKPYRISEAAPICPKGQTAGPFLR
ncbi:hypothetical protein DD556_15110 [Phaeobacter sp. JL2872]|nr:hypothetical protein DD556_15110 [Phaeobacter sp. JL2872]